MADIIHRIGIKAPADKVYAALATLDGLSHWWTRDTTGDASVGGVIRFRFQASDGRDLGAFPMDVLELTPGRRVRWRVREGALAPDWVGTELEFALSEQDQMTIVLFAHRQWSQATESMAHCSMKWATFLLSLRDYVQTGRGRPAPDDLKIDNWN